MAAGSHLGYEAAPALLGFAGACVVLGGFGQPLTLHFISRRITNDEGEKKAVILPMDEFIS